MELIDLFQEMAVLHEAFMGPLKIAKSSDDMKEYAGTIEVMQGKQKVQGHYFSSIMLKAKDVRFYFIPIYMYPEKFNLSSSLLKMLKGKSCFHLKDLNQELSGEIKEMIQLGLELMKKDNLI